MITVYKCERCGETHDAKIWIFSCIECGKETCESCMAGWATCEECAKDKTRRFLVERFDKAFG